MNQNEKLKKVVSLIKENCFSKLGEVQSDGGSTCERIFDGLYCWPRTKAGLLAVQSCNNDLLKSVNKTGLATRQCTENGTWFNEYTGRPWTNLSECGVIYIMDDIDEELIYETWLPVIKKTARFGYTVSILSLILALLIFITIKRLHCERNKLHMHLFISYILRGASFILKDVLFIEGTALSNDVEYVNGHTNVNYTWLCKLFISIRYYFVICNFAFMLMEGVYLHNLIFLNLFSESHGTAIYCFLGWAIPLVFVFIWALMRMLFEDTTCWTLNDQNYIGLLLEIPIGITVVVNFLLFLLIVKVLVLKIHFTSTFIQQKKVKFRKLLKSTLILIPLYGIPYTMTLILSFYVESSKILEIIWLFLDQSFTSFQGFFAALVYCLLNSEVHVEIKRKYSLFYSRQVNKECCRSRTISSNTQQFSLQNNDDALENLNLFGITDDDLIKKRRKSIEI
ncbi:parathyroid hormone/parathyroid hormone-related peptide receptor-like isoform X1 [Sitophilus oryzae]|uniref:Parathyroid hormone/parathyroid hormone-related peptide receptor-like isoform X1 n=1 Tax=Sitophilus oryzae TaxID=7048 RepID=A0A6J2YCR3_SITOR|nr:parathyroid hormone/parathyroid hormone-related peptide receptor-like isoform X1 [Sitophilus oryzae]